MVCTDPKQLAQLARMGPAAGHVAGSGATIALVAPTSEDAQTHDLVQFDLGQATMNIMLAAADLGMDSAHAGVHDQNLARRRLGSRRTGSAPYWSASGSRPTVRSGRSSGPTGARSTTWCTAVIGSLPAPWR